ncbi:MAG: hypothetical protein MI749_06805 [Desulfovibrionales bacterium]|nr:hypothetical protein [Desulfovibrionales bacterium]
MSVSLQAFRNTANYGNVDSANIKLKDGLNYLQEPTKEVVANNSFKSRTVTFLKNALGLRDTKNRATLDAFQQAAKASGKFDTAKVDSVFSKLRTDLQDGHKHTLTVGDVKRVLSELNDKSVYAGSQALGAALERGIDVRLDEVLNNPRMLREQSKMELAKISDSAEKALQTVQGSTTFNEKWSVNSGPMRNLATSLKGIESVVSKDVAFANEHSGLLREASALLETKIGGMAFSQWGTPDKVGEFAKNNAKYAAVRSELTNHLAKALSVSVKLNSAMASMSTPA